MLHYLPLDSLALHHLPLPSITVLNYPISITQIFRVVVSPSLKHMHDRVKSNSGEFVFWDNFYFMLFSVIVSLPLIYIYMRLILFSCVI